MAIGYKVKFENKPPELDVLLQKVKENTGLKIELDNETVTAFSCSSFPADDAVWLFYKENEIVIQSGRRDEIWYLLAATLATLIDFGGSFPSSYNLKMPTWACKKWEEVKDIQTTYPLWDDILELNEMFRLDR